MKAPKLIAAYTEYLSQPPVGFSYVFRTAVYDDGNVVFEYFKDKAEFSSGKPTESYPMMNLNIPKGFILNQIVEFSKQIPDPGMVDYFSKTPGKLVDDCDVNLGEVKEFHLRSPAGTWVLLAEQRNCSFVVLPNKTYNVVQMLDRLSVWKSEVALPKSNRYSGPVIP